MQPMVRCMKCGVFFPRDEIEHHEACCGGGACSCATYVIHCYTNCRGRWA